MIVKAMGSASRKNESSDAIRVEALRGFRECVEELGGDPEPLLLGHRLGPDVLESTGAFVSYRAMMDLLEATASNLGRQDFGLMLGFRQGPLSILGPLGVAMRHSATIGDALLYCSNNIQSYCPGLVIQLQPEESTGGIRMTFEIGLPGAASCRQAIERGVLGAFLAIQALSNGQAKVQNVAFTHSSTEGSSYYLRYFGQAVVLAMPFSGLVLDRATCLLPIPGRDNLLYELADNFLQRHFPPPARRFAWNVRSTANKLFESGRCNQTSVAGALKMHPRALQRRLRDEGTTFEELRDEILREAARRYLATASLSLSRVAELLGYSESSALTRSCRRWFARTPSEVRRQLICGSLPPDTL